MQTSTRRALIFVVALVAVAGVLFVALRGCTAMPWNKQAASGATVTVAVTRDFGGALLKSGQVRPASGDTVMDALKKVARVQTEYGGGFVSSIDDVASTTGSGGQQDWFYYVNGVLSGVGSTNRRVAPGDMVWWDYHPWSQGDFVPAVVGAYPRPFTRGYSEKQAATTVWYGDGMQALAREVGGYLSGKGANVTYDGRAAAFKKGAGPCLVFLTVQQAARTPAVNALLARGGKGGAFLSLEGGKLTALDAAGKPTAVDTALCAAVVSTGSGMGDGSPVWLVLCEGEAGVTQARRLLVSSPQSLELKVGVAANASGALYPLPR